MKICLRGWTKNTKNDLKEVSNFITTSKEQIKDGLNYDDDDIETMLHRIENGVVAVEAMRDVIIALLNGDMGKEESVKFFALEGKLQEHKYSNELIIINKN